MHHCIIIQATRATAIQAVEANWPDIYLSSDLAKENAANAERLLAKGGQAKQPTLVLTSTYAQPFRTQVRGIGGHCPW